MFCLRRAAVARADPADCGGGVAIAAEVAAGTAASPSGSRRHIYAIMVSNYLKLSGNM